MAKMWIALKQLSCCVLCSSAITHLTMLNHQRFQKDIQVEGFFSVFFEKNWKDLETNFI